MLKVFNREAFQGNLAKRHYFEGWYFKHVSFDLENVYSFIPGVSLSKENPHAFIQIINGTTCKTQYIQYKLEELYASKKDLYVKIGKSIFTDSGIKLNIDCDNMQIKGDIEYAGIVRYPKTIISPGIMGWYFYVPHMECNHGIVSINHNLIGSLNINGNRIDFTNGKGYIEKDWGTSFPSEWIWIHSNNFTKSNASLMISIANIPWLKNYFIGFISFIYLNGKVYKFATYNKSKITKLRKNEDGITVIIENKDYKMDVRVIMKKLGELLAPVKGDMSRRIKESIDSEVFFKLYDRYENLIYEDTGRRAGFEVIEKIFEHF